jgi:hypothetical protein
VEPLAGRDGLPIQLPGPLDSRVVKPQNVLEGLPRTLPEWGQDVLGAGFPSTAGDFLRLDPSLALLSSRWPIDRIFRVNQPEADPGIVVDLAAGGVHLEVRRIGDDAVFRALDRPTYAFRLELGEGRCLEEAAATALALDDSFDLAAAFQALFAEHLAIAFHTSGSRQENA